ncbi:hypothetical protein PUN28_006583 [Cardiocondyla obscurior]|uniref:Uncharacterized protein n=1 Tax=Cardiocondyla obscurior TaxID=286306 RepID=A0AAW2GFF8_9HYME
MYHNYNIFLIYIIIFFIFSYHLSLLSSVRNFLAYKNILLIKGGGLGAIGGIGAIIIIGGCFGAGGFGGGNGGGCKTRAPTSSGVVGAGKLPTSNC